jgi:hypothetical protein
MRADAGELGAVASHGHDDGTDPAADRRGRPDHDELAVFGVLDPAGADENVTHGPPKTHFGATDPRGRSDGSWRVNGASKTADTPAAANVEYIDVDGIVSWAAAAPHVPPLLADSLQEGNVLTHLR